MTAYAIIPGMADSVVVDNHVLELAVAGGAALLITHNVSDFSGDLKFPGIQVLTPGQFLRLKR